MLEALDKAILWRSSAPGMTGASMTFLNQFELIPYFQGIVTATDL